MTTERKNTPMLAKYQRAQTWMQGFGPCNIVANATIFPIWIDGSDCFWYERDINIHKNTENPEEPLARWDREYRLVNAKAATNTLAFDHNRLASALAEALGQKIDHHQLPITDVELQLNSTEQVNEIRFTAFEKSWAFEPSSGVLSEQAETIDSNQTLLSPDGKACVFVRDYNLWLQDITTGDERALTHDGEEHYCYAAVGNAWGVELPTLGPELQALWSADSKQLFTLQRDTRQVKTMPIVEHVPQDGSIRPKLHTMKLAIQGDENIPEYRLLAIDVDTGRVQAAHYPRVPIMRNSGGFFDSYLGWWSTDNRHAYFVDMRRGYQQVRVVEFDTTTGNTRVLFEETSETYLNLMVNDDELPTIMPLPETNELIWFSERSGWAHLYLYDLKTGELKNTITSGEWVVRNILSLNRQNREVFLHTMGRTLDRDPYYRDVVRVNMDTGELTVIAASNADYYAVSDHRFDLETMGFAAQRDIADARAISPHGEYAVATRSSVDTVPVTVLLDRTGKEILDIEQADMTALYARVSEQWQWPEPVQLLAADNETSIYGVVLRPSDFSPDQSYPVISIGYNAPELPRVPKGSFSGAQYCTGAALAELGFMVVQIDGTGTPFRGKAFQNKSYGWAESAGCIDDQVAGIKQLAERYPCMDLDRVGISTLGGGAGAVQGLLHYPEFFNVGVHGIVHDSRLMSTPMWSDKYEGLTGPDANHQYPEAYADKLQGKLMLVHGMLNTCGFPANTFRLIEALQNANKDFDMIMLPKLGHAFSNYFTRRSWDYLVTHLQKVEPPKEFKLM